MKKVFPYSSKKSALFPDLNKFGISSFHLISQQFGKVSQQLQHRYPIVSCGLFEYNWTLVNSVCMSCGTFEFRQRINYFGILQLVAATTTYLTIVLSLESYIRKIQKILIWHIPVCIMNITFPVKESFHFLCFSEEVKLVVRNGIFSNYKLSMHQIHLMDLYAPDSHEMMFLK